MLPGKDLSWASHLQHCFLIRDPLEVVASYSRKRTSPTTDDIGLIRQLELITRRTIIDLCLAHDIPVREKNFSLTDVYGSEEAFVTGTFAGVAPVTEVDGRILGNGQRGAMVERLQRLYLDLIESECT